MPFPSVSNTLIDGTAVQAGDHNTNFGDLISAMTDGSKDFTINSLNASSVVASTLAVPTISGNPTFTGSPTISGNLTVTGELLGSRSLLIFAGSNSGIGASDEFLGTGGSSTTFEAVYKMPRAGSVIGYSVGGRTSAFTSNKAVIFRIRKNGSTLISSNTLTWTANNQSQFDTATISRGTNTFAAGDTISLLFDHQSGTATVVSIIDYIEVQFDS